MKRKYENKKKDDRNKKRKKENELEEEGVKKSKRECEKGEGHRY